MAFTLAQLAQQLGAQVHGDGTLEIRKVATLEKAGKGDITFLSNKKYRHYLEQSEATAVLITEADLPFCPTNALVIKDPYVGFARVAQLLDTTPQPATDIHPSAVIAESAARHDLVRSPSRGGAKTGSSDAPTTAATAVCSARSLV